MVILHICLCGLLFLKLKSMLKSRRFKTIEKIEENSPQELLEVPRKEPYQQMKAFNLLTVYEEIFHLPDLAFPFGDESLALLGRGVQLSGSKPD
ncbi:hypothetical protein AVEN_61443-1 [Araneus ventricosus]|uniref:Uncharacterized protein n=1 Tax=Araneus ventricosus TaxID=182803 RepID=A0A4Y2KF38_ARAVE|nr:hypothetical protein AVEN_61443-1 [Araneus ventricosus]